MTRTEIIVVLRGNMVEVLNKKQQAFQLFSLGKRPSDPDCKALKLANKTLYKYFQQFKKNGHSTLVADSVPGKATQPASGTRELPLHQFVIGSESIPLWRSDMDDAYDQFRDCKDLGAQGDFSSFLRIAARYLRAIYATGVGGHDARTK